MQCDRWSWRSRAQARAADTGSSRSASCMKTVKEDLNKITPKRLRFIGWLQRRALNPHSAYSAECTKMAKALLKAILKHFGGSSVLLPKEILPHCAMSLAVTMTHLFTGTSAPEQRVTAKLMICCVEEAFMSSGFRDVNPLSNVSHLRPLPLQQKTVGEQDAACDDECLMRARG